MTEKKLKSLDEHNAEARAEHFHMNNNSPQPNGLECPQCGDELKDSAPMTTLTSSPPQKNIHCDSCGYKGFRIV